MPESTKSRYARFAALYSKAESAGLAAATAAVPTPMVLGPNSILVNGVPALDRTYVVSEGPCGFGWVTTKGNTSFARWLKKAKPARHAGEPEYGGGVMVRYVSEFGQSITRKEAFADAFAATLREGGVPAASHSRLD